ncbi:MAG: hypothetical protein IPL61_05445 [Myxococcales bacterium]|nr:hypothetical protein [Myxococcales bacterium]
MPILINRRLPLSSILLAAALGACTSADEPATAAAARDWLCVDACLPDRPCKTLCRLSIDEPGLQVVDAPSTCDDPLRHLNECGDGCCDLAEADYFGNRAGYCTADCMVEHRPWFAADGDSIQIFDGDILQATFHKLGLRIANVCPWPATVATAPGPTPPS